MSKPVVGSFGAELYEAVEPLAWADEENGWALLTLCGAIGEMFQQVRDLGSPDPDGNPGWSQLLDVTRCPTAYLPWLGQFVGVQVDTSLTDTQQRSQITNEAGMARGSLAAIRGAAQKYLTGSRTVQILERVGGDAYAFTVVTYTSETPDSAAVSAALAAAKPAGLVMTYEAVTGQIWAQLEANYATWADVIAAYTTWQDVINDTP